MSNQSQGIQDNGQRGQRGQRSGAWGASQEVCASMRTGDLLLCSGRAAMSRLIQRATVSRWSHIALLLHLEQPARIVVLESVESVGVRAVPLSAYLGDAAGVRRGDDGTLTIARHATVASMNAAQRSAMIARGIDLLGHSYDTREILRIAARIVAGEGRAPTSSSLQRDDCYICSEFVWECLHAGGVTIAHDRRGFIAPCDFTEDPRVTPLWSLSREGVITGWPHVDSWS